MAHAQSDLTAAVLAAVAAAAFLAAAVTLVWVDVLHTGSRPERDAVSDYGAGSYRWFYSTIVVSLGLGALLLLLAPLLALNLRRLCGCKLCLRGL